MPALLLVVLSLLLMVARVASPRGQRATGKDLLTVRLGLRERMLYHRTGLYCFGAILLLLGITRLLSPSMQLLAVVACYGVLTIPIRYRLTTDGIGLNGLVFRPWSEFDGVTTSRRAVTLRGRPGNGRFTLSLFAEHQAEALRIIQRQIGVSGAPRPAAGKGGRRAKPLHARTTR